MLTAGGPEGRYTKTNCTQCNVGFWAGNTAARVCRKCRVAPGAAAESRARRRRAAERPLLTRAQISDVQSRDLTPEDLQLLLELYELEMAEARGMNSLTPEVLQMQPERDVAAPATNMAGLSPEDMQMPPEPHGLEMIESTLEQDLAAPSSSLSGGSWRRTANGWRTGVPTMDAAAFACLATPDSSTWVGESCAFCLQELQRSDEVRALPRCQHAFHRACLQPWLARKAECPVCRTGCGS